MPASDIEIRGAREHNLQSVNLTLPRNHLICLTGVSGSGKSSLAFDTLYAEGQRRYVESLSTFARQFLGQMPKPEVDYVSGLSPSISISQKSSGRNPRSTVGTITEIHDFLRVLFARVGQGYCPRCDIPVEAQSREQILARILDQSEGRKLMVLAPLIRQQKGEHRDLCEDLLRQGYVRARIDGAVVSLTETPALDRQMRHDIEVVVDRLTIQASERLRLAESMDAALKLGEGVAILAPEPEEGAKKKRRRKDGGVAGDEVVSIDYSCSKCGASFQPPTPQMFSFNSPQGMCSACDGLGDSYTFDPKLLVPDDSLTLKQGCIEILGPWKKLSRWKRHIFQGFADTMSRKLDIASDDVLETPWSEMSKELKRLLLWGAGDEHITYTWRGGDSPNKYGGTYDGVIPELLEKYEGASASSVIKKLELYMNTITCPDCQGRRLNAQASNVRLASRHPSFSERPALSLPDVSELAVSRAAEFFSELDLDAIRGQIAAEALKEVRTRLGFLINVGLDYLSLDRRAPTLSGGESQRIRLAGQIGSGLVGVLYILDEPSIGLHPRDNDRLLGTLQALRDMGNTVVVVEHDEDTMRAADHLIDFGPGPGVRGGRVVAQGAPDAIEKADESVTGKYLSGALKIETPNERRTLNVIPSSRPGKRPKDATPLLSVVGAKLNNLKDVTVDIPLGAFVCITGVSGSGKSSLVNGVLVEVLRRDLNGGLGEPGPHREVRGLEHLDKLIAIDQSPIGRTPRSNPGTYIKVFDEIRKLFSQLPEAKRRGYKPGRFSFNVRGGRCEACEGNGSNRLEMDFLADVWVTCPVCEGKRFNRETLQVLFKGHSVADVLDMDIQQALTLFENIPAIKHRLGTLHDVGLDYLKIGQPSPTLSGGEAQRVKLARELVKRATGSTLYLLDEPTTGLHFADIHLLLRVLHDFVAAGNTVLVVEHNLDVIKTADWIIDLGPEGGDAGGRIVVAGTPEQVAEQADSHTGRALKRIFDGETRPKLVSKTQSSRSNGKEIEKISVRGARQHNLRDVDVSVQRDQLSVFCGHSGSGKSSLAMDTIYAEGQRRYVESLSSYARQFVSQMQKPALDHIEGLSPAIAIEQKNLGNTPRSTVGTVTEVYDYLRILLARLGQPYCPDCDQPIGEQTSDQIVDKILREPGKAMVTAPIEADGARGYEQWWKQLLGDGYRRIRVDGETHEIEAAPEIDRRARHEVEVVVDRLTIDAQQRGRLAEAVEAALSIGRGVIRVVRPVDDVDETRWPAALHSQHLACDRCGRSFERLSPHNFSFNSMLGWCQACEGLGVQSGANPAALIRDPKRSLKKGALDLWPDLKHPLSKAMLEAVCEATGVPMDTPFQDLPARQRRVFLHGAGEQWYTARVDDQEIRFQFKGLYPALNEAAKLSPGFRTRLQHLVTEVECSACGGSRLRDDAAAVRFRDRTMDELCATPLGKLVQEVGSWKLSGDDKKVAGEIIREIQSRVQFLVDVGLAYLSLGRGAATLSNGEAQRIRLASQLGSGLCGVLYVLDEPTIGLHPRDNRRLLTALKKLRDLGNTLIVVEHDREVLEEADRLFDFGPGAGKRGGEIVAEGSPKQLSRKRGSVTGPYLSGKRAIPIPTNRRIARFDDRAAEDTPEELQPTKQARKEGGLALWRRTDDGGPIDWLEILGARRHNLRNISAPIPLGTLTAVTGPSGSGKSSLVRDTLHGSLAERLHRASRKAAEYDAIMGVEHINKAILVDQQPLGSSPASNPATYTGAFDEIRTLFSQLSESRLRGYSPRRFSFNVPGGRCDACEGQGQVRIEMHFLPDVWVPCEVCAGQRYNPETLAVRYHGKSIADVLEMSCGEAVELFDNIPRIRRVLQTLCDVGLDYVALGQSAPTLSGGEAQRVKLAAELSRPDTGRTLYVLDEPTTGLHFDDIYKLLDVLHRLVDLGNTVVVIEHNLDVIKTADWVIELGPEAGAEGGRLVCFGDPETIVDYAQKAAKDPKRLRCHTGEALAPQLASDPKEARPRFDPHLTDAPLEGDVDPEDLSPDTPMPWQVDGRAWHCHDRVDRRGKACRWEGRVLEEIVDRIQGFGAFGDTNWDARSVVEICGPQKSEGWYFHAITAETWFVRLKFRFQRKAFNGATLASKLALDTWNQMDEIEIYGNEPRVKYSTLKGQLCELQLDVHRFDEINTDEFWQFLEKSADSFMQMVSRSGSHHDATPWVKLGRQWHVMRKGFPLGKSPAWESTVLEQLFVLLEQTAPDGKFHWKNQKVVHLFVPEQREAWASIYTKNPEAVVMRLTAPKGKFAFGRVADVGSSAEYDGATASREMIKLKFQSNDDVSQSDFAEALRDHLQAVREGDDD